MKIKSINILSIAMLSSMAFNANALENNRDVTNNHLVVAQADPHAGHDMSGSKANKAKSKGTIHSVDVGEKSVNLTHDPIPELGWPKMTMDLAATKRVKLKNFKEGDVVEFEIKKGRDNMFRITKMKKAK